MKQTSITKELISTYLIPRNIDSEKHDFGHALLIAGSYGMIGAACLAAKASLRSGLGMLTVHVPTCGYNILQTSVPEAMVLPSVGEHYLHHLPDIHRYEFIAIGPGLNTKEPTVGFVDDLLSINKKLIIDADAITIIAKNNWQNRIVEGSLITPNIREFNRFFNRDGDNNSARIEFENICNDSNINIILKGANTLVSIVNKGIFENTTGNAAMAKGGSGDVLSGMLLGLWARTNDLEKASLLGVYLHGLAGDIALQKIHEESVLPSDVIECISEALFEL